jgi:hypothetical protein
MASQRKILRGALFRLIKIITAYEPDKALWTERLMSEVIQSVVLKQFLASNTKTPFGSHVLGIWEYGQR